jgi:hypothetical protein
MSGGFEETIRPLFREADRFEMKFAFDLFSYADVVVNAAGILERLDDGTMPCDEPWPPARVEIFRSWLERGCPT